MIPMEAQLTGDRLFAEVEAVQKGWEDLANAIDWRLQRGTAPWEDLEALHRTALEADRRLRIEIAEALEQLEKGQEA